MEAIAISRDDVSQEVSPDDTMFRAHNPDHYFRVGRSALEGIALSLRAAGKSAGDVERVLDLPCGHGRVLRYLRRAFPAAEITASDLLAAGVDYCASAFGARPVYSHEDFAKIPFGDASFDLIWVGSLLTHLDAPRCRQFLDVIGGRLRPGGVLVFTTHGRDSYRGIITGRRKYGLGPEANAAILGGYEREGFGYADYTHGCRYGLTVSSPTWVMDAISRTSGLRLVHFAEAAWDAHQDVFAVAHDPDWVIPAIPDVARVA